MPTFSYYNPMEWSSIKIHPWNELGRSSLDVRWWEYFRMNNRLNLTTRPPTLPLLFILTDFSKNSIKADILRLWPQIPVFYYFVNSEPIGRQFKNVSQSPNSPLFTFRQNTQNMDGHNIIPKIKAEIEYESVFWRLIGCKFLRRR